MKKLFLLLVAVISFGLCAVAQNRTVKGQVLSADGEPLVGASVLGVGTQSGVATDIDGNFSLLIPASVKTLQVAYVGMETLQVPVSNEFMRIVLQHNNMLDEVITVAYGTSKKSAYTGAASVVDAKVLEDRLVSNVTNALSGVVAGVQTLSSNGQPGTSSTVRIRGVGSINASMNPLYVLDGIPYDGDIASINPSDIEQMTVLKDAAAAALYGARGANGVILITTKKGKQGKATVTLDMRWGTNSRQVKNYDVITSPQEFSNSPMQHSVTPLSITLVTLPRPLTPTVTPSSSNPQVTRCSLPLTVRTLSFQTENSTLTPQWVIPTEQTSSVPTTGAT